MLRYLLSLLLGIALGAGSLYGYAARANVVLVDRTDLGQLVESYNRMVTFCRGPVPPTLYD